MADADVLFLVNVASYQIRLLKKLDIKAVYCRNLGYQHSILCNLTQLK